MSVQVANEVQDATENWDDDFEFQPTQENNPHIPHTRRSTGSSRRKDVLTEEIPPLLRDTKNTLNTRASLQHWAEAGPSTPSKRVHSQTENWDDDFQEMTDSPLRQHASESSPRSSPRSRRSRRRPSVPALENWDDDFEEGKASSPSSKSARWDSSSSSGEEHGFGAHDEDRTVTSRTRRGALPRTASALLPHETPPPPVPPLPHSLMGTRADPTPFPRSPTASVFSVPVSARDSVAAYSYSSTAHLALRPTLSGSSLGALPPSPPIHHARERRRLRKKSRPARVDYNIYEMEDRADAPLRPVTPEQVGAAANAGDSAAAVSPVEGTPQSAGKSSLVSRIGSVGKKWGASRRKRASTGPADVVAQERNTNSRPNSMALPSPPASSSKGSWFFRHGGVLGAGSGSPPHQTSALPLKHEKSVDRLLSLVGFEHGTPSKAKRKEKEDSSSDLAGSSDNSPAAFPFGPPKRPASMQVSSTSQQYPRSRTSRHASYTHGQERDPSSSRSSSVARSASGSVEELARKKSRGMLGRDEKKTPRGPKHYSSEQDAALRALVGDTRKLNLKSKHKRSQSNAPSAGSGDGPRPSTSTTGTAVPRHLPDRGDDTTPRPPSRVMGRPSGERSLLPPIELQPPSPPQATNGIPVSMSEPAMSSPFGIDALLEPRTPLLRPSPSSPLSVTPSMLQSFAASPSPSPTRVKPSTSPQAASLGRSTQVLKEREIPNGTMPRRNSLGDLKIPDRITQAQVGLRRDLGMVREFAASIDQLRELQTTYLSLMSEVQAHLVETLPAEQHKTRAVSPTFFGLPRPASRARSNTNPQMLTPPTREEARYRHLIVTFRSIEARYRLSWECAELLIELGGGPTADQEPSEALLAPSQSSPQLDGRKSRERAVTLAGDESKPQIVMPNMSHTTLPTANPSSSAYWRASGGRHDLSHRQLVLLRDMLSSPDASAVLASEYQIPEEDVNRGWRWGDAMSSTVTLPTEESSQAGSNTAEGRLASVKKRKSSRLGMRGLRDMLRSLKKTYSESSGTSQNPHGMELPAPSSSTSVSMSTDSSLSIPQEQPVVQRRRAKTSIGPESMRSLKSSHPNSPYATTSLTHRSSPRRPSLASIFRLGQKSKSSTKSSPHSQGSDLPMDSSHNVVSDISREPSSSHGTEEDWDRVESSSDLDLTSAPSTVRTERLATIRGKKGRSPYSLQPPPESASGSSKRGSNPSRSSIWSFDSPQTPARKDMSRVQSPPDAGARTTKLSNVQELMETNADLQHREPRRSSSRIQCRASGAPSPSPKRPRSRASKLALTPSSVRDTQGLGLSPGESPDRRMTVAMTPENIKPLLENAKEVQARCRECLGELRQLLDPQP